MILKKQTLESLKKLTAFCKLPLGELTKAGLSQEVKIWPVTGAWNLGERSRRGCWGGKRSEGSRGKSHTLADRLGKYGGFSSFFRSSPGA